MIAVLFLVREVDSLRSRPILCVALAVILSLLALLVGCSGGSGPVGTRPASREPAVSGQVQIPEGLSASDLQIVLDGQPLPRGPRPDGSFAIFDAPPGPHTISIIGPDGDLGIHVGVQLAEDVPVDLGELDLEAGGQIAGIVSEETSEGLKPVAGAAVTAWPPWSWVYPLDNGDADAGTPRPVQLIPAEAPSADPEQPPLVLPSPGDDDTPVILPPEPPAPPGTLPPLPPRPFVLTDFTDEDGAYALSGLPPGEYVVEVVIPGYEADAERVNVEAGVTIALDFVLEPIEEPGIGTVAGTVWAGDEGVEEPVPGAMVTLTANIPWRPPWPFPLVDSLQSEGAPVPSWWFELTEFSTLTDNEGRFSLNAPAGTVEVNAYYPGLGHAGQELSLQRNQVLNIELHLVPWDEDDIEPLFPGSEGTR